MRWSVRSRASCFPFLWRPVGGSPVTSAMSLVARCAHHLSPENPDSSPYAPVVLVYWVANRRTLHPRLSSLACFRFTPVVTDACSVLLVVSLLAVPPRRCRSSLLASSSTASTPCASPTSTVGAAQVWTLREKRVSPREAKNDSLAAVATRHYKAGSEWRAPWWGNRPTGKRSWV